MKKVLLTVVFLIVTSQVGAAPMLVEAYQGSDIYIPTDGIDTLVVAQISFSVDTACYVQFGTGGLARRAKAWLELDSDILPPVARINSGDEENLISFVYTYYLTAGEHTVELYLTNYWNTVDATTCTDGYLQALIFLPDEASAITEQPASDNGLKPIAPSAVISKGPYVTVTGATELVDSTGRVIENAIDEDKVYINNLPMGTYFARDGEQTVVKIVKVQ